MSLRMYACIVLTASLCSLAKADATLLMYLSGNDPGPLPPIPNPQPPNYPGIAPPPEFATGTNPQLTQSTRLWIWANQLSPRVSSIAWDELSLNIVSEGAVTLSNLVVFNPNSFFFGGISYPRWDAVVVPPVSMNSHHYDDVVMIALQGYGVRSPPDPDGYSDAATGNILLGYFDAAYTPGGPGAIWLELGSAGFDRASPPGERNFAQLGFGDPPLLANIPEQRSALPEATFVPEPTSWLPMSLCMIFIARQARR